MEHGRRRMAETLKLTVGLATMDPWTANIVQASAKWGFPVEALLETGVGLGGNKQD